MIIVIKRLFTKGEFTHGSLSIDGTRICSTLENSNAQVPSGEYQLSLLKCKQYARKMPCLNLLNLEPETWNLKQRCAECKRLPFVCNNTTLPCWCPQIKPGNGVHKRLDGSIIVGVYNCLGSIIKPRDIFDALYERIRKSISRGNKVILCVK
ncbi:DUF5675 family protein [uncultured Prevotella sp.]|uniref:DUF5675 family protein n=1 Tax=uncultured Prevotella sp. TaxID=159272 RepID=UPI0025886DB0|nr:DUF5675 family protein [uncultured Prevotella sp.]